jgi:ATP-binding cassette subfamily C protein
LSLAAPGQRQPLVSNVTFQLQAGSGLGIIGPSASGKSTLARGIVGVWQPLSGSVRLDNAALDQWHPESLGQHIGYLPQDIELFDGTIAENIARFDPDASMDAVIAAARTAVVHDMILRLPEGYNTRLGESGTCLSAGQRQRVALARALCGDPFLVVLDEPNSNLDNIGDAGLTQAILSVRACGGIVIVIVIAHRPSAIEGVDQLLVMNEGRPYAFGPNDRIGKKVVRTSPPHVAQVVPRDRAAATPFSVCRQFDLIPSDCLNRLCTLFPAPTSLFSYRACRPKSSRVCSLMVVRDSDASLIAASR